MIPRIIHQVWVGGTLPDHLRHYVDLWQQLHPDWEHRIWTDGDLDWLVNRAAYDDMMWYVKPWGVGPARADIARYEIIARHGGLYVDCDTEPLRPVDEALEGRTELAAWEPFGDIIGNTYIAAVPEHPALLDLIGEVGRSVATARRHRANVPAVLTGPRVLTPIWKRHDCYVAPAHEWFPYSYAQTVAQVRVNDFSNAYAVHHWGYIRELQERGQV